LALAFVLISGKRDLDISFEPKQHEFGKTLMGVERQPTINPFRLDEKNPKSKKQPVYR
jgi:hypothetical protein